MSDILDFFYKLNEVIPPSDAHIRPHSIGLIGENLIEAHLRTQEGDHWYVLIKVTDDMTFDQILDVIKRKCGISEHVAHVFEVSYDEAR